MIKRGSGHIVNISSVAGWIGAPGIASYCASKFGLRGYSESLAVDVAEINIKVSTVYPYFSRTPILDSERFGYAESMVIPDDMVTDPADVVAAIIRGVKRNRLHIFPDKMARRIHYIKRYIPWMIPILNRRMQQRIVQPD
jgi:short-subunit dehydrogenase